MCAIHLSPPLDHLEADSNPEHHVTSLCIDNSECETKQNDDKA